MDKPKDNAKLHIVLVQGLVFKNDEILIGQRSFEELQAPGKWSIPGGKVEFYNEGNTTGIIEDTLKKEIFEEVGVKIDKKIEYLKSGFFVRNDGSSVVVLVFICNWKSGIAESLEDTIAVKWVSKENYKEVDYAIGVKDLIELGLDQV